ncbi:nuclear transport factor 2 family protein, partial [Streptococcus sp. DD11]
MKNIDRLLAFFEAENQRDWDTYQTFLAEQVVWELQSDSLEVICGKADYLARIQMAYRNNPVQFQCSHYHLSPD